MNLITSKSTRALGYSLSRLKSATAVCAALSGVGAWALATTDLWTAGSTTDLLWDTPGNWSLGAAPTAVDDVLFGTPIPNPGSLATPGTITLGVGELAHSLTFRDAYALTGGDLALGAGGNVTVAPAISVTINSALIGTNGLTLAGSNGLTTPDDQVGGGTLVLGGVNTYSGATTINAGVLSFSDAANLGDSSATNGITLGGGTLRNTGTLVGLGLTRTVNVSATSTIDTTTGTALAISGVLSSSAGAALNKIGAGTLTLSGTTANTTAGAINVVNGVLELNKTTGVDAIGSGGVTITSNTASPATVRLLANEQISDSAIVTLNANGGALSSFDLNDFTETVGALNLSSTTVGSATIRTGANGVLVLNGDIVFNNNRGATGNNGRETLITGTGTYGTAAPSGTLDLGGAVRTITVQSNNTQLNSDATIETVIQNGGIIKAGSRTLNLRGTNTFAGGIIATGGLVSFTADANLGDVANPLIADGGGFSWAGTGAFDPTSSRVFTITASGGFLNTVNAGTSGKILLNDAGQITGSGALTTTGAGVVQLAAANTGFNGAVTVAGGFLELQNDQALGTVKPAITLAGGEFVITNRTWDANITGNSGALSGDGGNSTFSGVIDVAGNITANTRDFNTTGNGRTLTLSGALTNSGILNVGGPTAGTGTLVLSGNNSSFSGRINVNANAVLSITNPTARGTGVVNLSGGTLRTAYLAASAPTVGVAGLNATYFNFGSNPGINSSLFATDRIDLAPRAFTRIDADINVPNSGQGTLPTVPVPGFALGAGPGGVQDGIMWKGLLNITSADSYQFSGINDDNLVLIIDGQQIGLLGVTGNTNTNIGGAVTLSAGYHSIVVKQTQGTGGGYAVVRYSGADTANNTVVLGAVPNSVFTGSLAAIDLGAIGFTANGTIDLLTPATAPSLDLGNGILTITSPTIDDLTVASGTISSATATLAPTSGGLIFTGAIGDGGSGFGVKVAGPYFTEFQAANTFTGLTNVTGGQLRLNAAGGNSIAGDLTVNAATTGPDVANVRLLLSNQIADTAAVSVLGGILDLGSQSDTVNALTLSGGQIIGSGTLTVSNGATLSGGSLIAHLAGAGGVTVNAGTNTAVLANSNSYTGMTNVNSGTLRLVNGTLGAGGAGNGTTVAGGAQLLASGALDLGNEDITLNDANGLRVLAGKVSTTGAVAFGAGVTGATLRVDAGGEFVVSGPIGLGGSATINKTGDGALIFSNNNATLPNVTLLGGALGFSGPQSFGAATVPAGLAFQFDSDPGAGVNITAPTGTRVIAGYAPTSSLLSRIGAASVGSLVLTQDTANALDFTANPSLSLGANGLVTSTGALTAGASGFHFGGGTGRLTIGSSLAGGGGVTIGAGTTRFLLANTFTGDVTLDPGSVLVLTNDDQLGAAANAIVLNGGTLQTVNAAPTTFGSSHLRVSRNVQVGAAGGTIDVINGTIAAFNLQNYLGGSGTLTKTGFGEFQNVNTNDFAGNVVIATNGGSFQIRAGGQFTNLAGITINPGATLTVDDNNGVGIFASLRIADRLADTTPIVLAGGTLFYNAKNSAGNTSETFGTVTLQSGQSSINTNINGQGSDVTISNLVHTLGSTVRFAGTVGTLGSTGNNARVLLTQVNGAAPNAALIGGWATINSIDFARYTATGIQIATYTNQGATNFTPTAAQLINLNAAGTAMFDDSGSNALEMLSLRFGNGAAQTLAFTDTNDVLYIGSGGVLTDGTNFANTLGATAGQGSLTAGVINATAPQELFLHNNSNTLTINSAIIDNPSNAGATVGLVKDLDGQVTLAVANGYTGGTFVNRGTLQANVAGALGSGSVAVKNSRLTLNNPGSVNSTTSIITAADNAEIFLQNTGALFTMPGDRFSITAGSSLFGQTNGTGGGMASLTRVAGAPVTGGDVHLDPGAIVGHNTTLNGDVGSGLRTIQNLGTEADLFFGLSNTFNGGAQQFITVGNGTPWMGLSTDRSSRQWSQGTIFANSDFTLQGLARDGGFAALTLGQDGSIGSYSIVNRAGVPINAFVTGTVTLNEDTPVSLPSDLTFLVAAGAIFQPNRTSSLGSDLNPANNAKIRVQAGGTLDPGNFVLVGAAANQPFGHAYPVPGPLNGYVTIESGGRFLVNDASGIGTSQTGTLRVQSGGILELGNVAAFLGSNAGLIADDQFVFEPGAIVRPTTDNIFNFGRFASGPVILQAYAGNRTFTNQNDLFTPTGAGIVVFGGQDVTLTTGGGLINDSNSRTINEGRGRILVDGAITIAATTGTDLNINEGLDFQPGASATIGSTGIDGNPKIGRVRLTANNTNTGDQTNVVSVSGNGSILSFANLNVFPDAAALNLADPVTSFTGSLNDDGSALRLEQANNAEFIGALTGNGAVFAQNNGTGNPAANFTLLTGYGTTTNYTFGGVIKSTNNQNPILIKVGPSQMTLANTSDSTGFLAVYQGELVLGGANGRWTGGELRLGKSGTLTFDNSVVAVADRQAAGSGNRWLTTAGGGEFKLLGNATQVADVQLFGLAASAGSGYSGISTGNTGGFGKVTVVPAMGTTSLTTSLTFGLMENFQNTGDRNAAWLLRGPGLAGLPGSYDTLGNYTPNPANPVDGLVFITTPNLLAAGAYGQSGTANGFIAGAAGTSVVPVRGDLLAATSLTATTGDFATIDIVNAVNRTGIRVLQASEYAPYLRQNQNTNLNVRATGALTTTGDTRFQVLKLEDGASLAINGTLPNLTQPSQVILNAGGLLIPAGASATINASGDSLLRSNGGVSLYVHAFGDVNINGSVFSDQGFVKTGSGTATFGPGSLTALRGRYAIHEGTVVVNDSFGNVRNTGVNTSGWNGPQLELTGGTLNINGHDQFFDRFESGTLLADAGSEGGTLTSFAPATVSMQGSGTFSGHVTGAISLQKFGNNTLVLTNTNPTTGALQVRQGTVLLRDSGTLSNVSSIALNYGRIDADSSYLENVNNRINPSATVNFRGGDFVLRGHASAVTTQTLATVNLLQGQNLFQTLSGGNGSAITTIGNLVRSPGATTSFQQNYGTVGAAGDTSTAIRYLIEQLNNAVVSLTNNIIGGWAVVNNDSFATYDPVRGVGALGNTTDGFATYDSTDLSSANTTTGTLNYNDGTSRTIAVDSVVNSIRNGPGAAQTLTLSGGLTINSGGLLTNANQAITYTGGSGSITSASGELNLYIQQNTTSINVPITGAIALTKAGSGTLSLGAANNYTGATYFNAGSSGASTVNGNVSLNLSGANGTTIVSVPSMQVNIHNSTVTELQPSQINQAATVNLFGGAILFLRDAAVTETLAAITFNENGGDNASRTIVSRPNAQVSAALNLTAATPIIATNSNPTSTPTVRANIGTINFTGNAGSPQTLLIDSPIGSTGLAAVGMTWETNIGVVPTGVAEGGLVKAGTGLLVLAATGTGQFGNPSTPTEVLNIQSGAVRADNANALGSESAITTVQSGAGLFFNNNGGLFTGSIRLKNGSRLGATINSANLGVVGSTGFLDVPAGASVQIDAFDSFIPFSNNGNITVNHLLTGAGTINLVGPQLATGYGGGGVFSLRNIANNFSGTIRVGTNSVLESLSTTNATGSTIGTATISLDGGDFRVRDTNGGVYGNNITLTADSILDVDRQGTTTINQTITFGTLNVAAGTHVLNTIYSQGNPIAGNGFRTAFTQVDGSGTLVKGGTRFVDLNAYAPTFSGNIEIAGPQGISLSTSGNLTLNAATNSLQNLSVKGFHTITGNAVDVAGVLDVSANAGAVTNGTNGVVNGAITGALIIDPSASLTIGTLRNNGVIGANGGAVTIFSNTIQGSGRFQTVGQPITLVGSLANQGATPTKLVVSGDSFVTLTNPVATSTGGAEVQSGTLRIAPTGASMAPVGSGPITVVGIAATTAGTNSQPVAGQQAVLQFDGGGSAITRTGNITNSGRVQIVSGSTTILGTIAGTTTSYLPGLLEGRIAGGNFSDFSVSRQANPGQFGIVLEPRLGQTNVVTQNPLTGWSDNETWVYTGQFNDADGAFTFAENIDDNTFVSIDGVTRLLNNSGTNAYQTVTSTALAIGQRGTTLDTASVNTGTPTLAFGMGPDGDGWHTIEVRFRNGTGGAGPAVGNGWANNFGFGLNTDGTTALDGSQFSRPIDPGDGSLFRTSVGGKGSIDIAAGAALSAGAIDMTATTTINGSSSSVGTLTLTNTSGVSNTDVLAIAGFAPLAIINVAGGQIFNAAAATFADSANVLINDAETGTVTIGDSIIGNATMIGVEGGVVNFTGVGTGFGGSLTVGGGAAANILAGGSISGSLVVSNGVAAVNGTLFGSANVASGTLKGSGVITGAVTLTGGSLAPGNGPGALSTGTLDLQAPANLTIEIGGNTAGTQYDQLLVTGGVNLAGSLQGSLINGFAPQLNDVFYLILNDGTDAVGGTFAGLAEGSTVNFSGYGWTVTYTANGDLGTFGNDVALIAQVPEPGSAVTLLTGLASLLGLRRFRRRA